ncbi:Ig-like domain-containing protein [Archangium violaceum]|uniref:adventurous gliding motility protein AgmC n=1 Tax=Archangium violaceum TaxID=83451 RepID=UPI002B31CE39|nr:Ig-like domain-containing protein [Archangium gephyra]
MSSQNMRWPRTAVLAAVLLVSAMVRAETDRFNLGTGRDGPLTVSSAGTSVNRYAQVVEPLATGDRSIAVAADSLTGFNVGDLIMVLQTTGIVPVPASGNATVIGFTKDMPVGRWELARIGSIAASTVTLTQPLVYPYTAMVTQIIRVPEYSTVQIDTGASIEAAAWNGATGGVVAFLAQTTLTNNGRISAKGAGFRGGQPVNDTSGAKTCIGLDEPAPNGAQRGEGLANVRYGASETGRGNLINAGGGGVCLQAGGGGGANGGTGGRGGFSHNTSDNGRVVGGMPGAQISFDPFFRLFPGGGGGAGHGANASVGAGGRGGGIIFIRANTLEGTGVIDAAGANAVFSSGGNGAGGGGAGGTVYVRLAGTASCGQVRAEGGAGGGTNGGGTNYVGPGGGGGGGVVLLQSSGGTCTTLVSGGSFGTKQDNSSGVSYGSGIGLAGVVRTYNSGYTLPSAATVLSPAEGAYVSSPTNLFVSGKAPANSTATIYVDGAEFASQTADASGDFSAFGSGTLTQGSHRVEVAAEYQGAWSERTGNNFIIDSKAPNPPVIAVPLAGSSIATLRPTFSGTAEPHGTVSINLSGTELAPSTVDASGNWSITPSAALEERSYTAAVSVIDAAGNRSSLSSVSFKVDVTAPQTVLGSVPASSSTSTAAMFTFSSNEEPVSFECSLDGAEESAFASCSSPLSLTVSDGRHTFKVRARDAAGNVDATPAEYSWTVDTGAPDVVMTEKPASITKATSARFAFGSTDVGSTFECALDGAALTSCTSPVELSGLAEGSHSFKVVARDVVGNVSVAPGIWNWTVDITAPAAPVVVAPTEGQKIEDSNLTISGTAEPKSTVRILIGTTVAGSVTAGASGDWSFSPSPSPGNGNYSIKATATDEAGNTSPESGVRNFVVELKGQPGDGDSSGCGCAASGFDPAMSMMALAGLAAFVSRRRRL